MTSAFSAGSYIVINFSPIPRDSARTFFIGYDVVADKGKARGGGSRCIFPTELPTHWAKSRTLADHIVYQQGQPQLWKQLFNKE